MRDATDAFVVEGVVGYVVGLLDVRGPGAGTAYETFCREALDDPRAGTSVLGLQATAALAELGHPATRDDAADLLASADPALRAGLPPWCAQLGRAHLVEAGSLQNPDGSETVLHVMLDYDEPSVGSRHLLSIAVQHVERRVHLLDVRARASQDSIAPIADAYAGSPTVRWAWRDTGRDLGDRGRCGPHDLDTPGRPVAGPGRRGRPDPGVGPRRPPARAGRRRGPAPVALSA